MGTTRIHMAVAQAYVATVNAEMADRGLGPNNLTALLSPTGEPPITHTGCSGPLDLAASINGVTWGDWLASLPTRFPGTIYDVGGTVSWSAWITSQGLVRYWPPEDEA